MALVIQSGEVSEMPQPSKAFPKCMNWRIDNEPPNAPVNSEPHGTPWFDEAIEDGCVGLCSNNTDDKNFITAESLMITGVALLICVTISGLMLGVLHCLKKQAGRARRGYQKIRWAPHGHIQPYSSLSYKDEPKNENTQENINI